MIQRAVRRSVRGLLRVSLIAAGVGVAVFGCRSDLAAWRARLAAPDVQRLVGVWDIWLRTDSAGPRRRQVPEVVGQIALTLNEGRLSAPSFGEPPMFFGSYDINVGRVGISTATYAGLPALAGRLRDDTLELTLGPHSPQPVELTGRVAGDSVAGRWSVHQRAGPDGGGDFVLRRR